VILELESGLSSSIQERKREKLIMGINHSRQINRIYRGNGIIVVN